MNPAQSDDRSEPAAAGGPSQQPASLPSLPGRTQARSLAAAPSLLESRTESFRRYLEFNPHFDALKERISELSANPEIAMGGVRVTAAGGVERLAGNAWIDLPLAGQGEIAGVSVSPGGRYIAVGTSKEGSDWETWEIHDLASPGSRPDILSDVRYSSPAWNAAGDALIYARYPAPDPAAPLAPLGPQALFVHAPGRPQASDAAIFSGTWPASRLEAYSLGDSLAIIDRDGCGPRADLHLRGPDGASVRIDTSDLSNLRYAGSDGSALYFTADAKDLSRGLYSLSRGSASLQPVVLGTQLDAAPLHFAMRVASGFLAVKLEDMAHRTFLSGAAGSVELPIPQGGTVHSAWEEEGEIRLLVSSYTHPLRVIGFDPDSCTVRDVSGPAATVDPSRYVTRLVYCKSDDGADIPVSLFYCAGSALADRPVLLSAYGGFGEPLTRAFSPSRLAWAEAGGVWAEVAVRGGGELGEAWHQPWVGDGKQRASADLVAAAEGLLASGTASGGSLALTGYSTGGLVAAKALLARPDLFEAGVVHSGLLDLERYTEYSAGAAWVDEFGDPAALAGSSPVAQARAGGSVPALLVTAGLGDEKVPPAHSQVFVEALEAHGNQVFVLAQSGAGHRLDPAPIPPTGPAAEIAIERRAAELAFLMDSMGME